MLEFLQNRITALEVALNNQPKFIVLEDKFLVLDISDTLSEMSWELNNEDFYELDGDVLSLIEDEDTYQELYNNGTTIVVEVGFVSDFVRNIIV